MLIDISSWPFLFICSFCVQVLWIVLFVLADVGETVEIDSPSTDIGTGREDCPEDYAPCTCKVSYEGLRVTCSEVSVQEIVDVFNRTTARDLYTFNMQWTRTTLETVTIPSDLLGDSRAEVIGVNCPSKVTPLVSLRIDNDAFRSSRDYAVGFLTFYCDWSQQLDLHFLAGFNHLTILEIGLATDLRAIGTLPSLPALTKLHVMDSTGLVEFPDLAPAVLQVLFLNGNQMDNAMAARLLDSILSTPSIRLFTLRLNMNRLTKIPTQQLASFSELTNLYIDENYIPVIETGSLAFSFPVTTLSLTAASINTIEPGAFQGFTTFYFILFFFFSQPILSFVPKISGPFSGISR